MNFKTQAEIFQALLDGKKLRSKNFCLTKFLHLKDGLLYGAAVADEHNIRIVENFNVPEDWSIYEEPKPKKQVWQWRYFYMGTWRVDTDLLTEEEVKGNGWKIYEKHVGPFEVS